METSHRVLQCEMNRTRFYMTDPELGCSVICLSVISRYSELCIVTMATPHAGTQSDWLVVYFSLDIYHIYTEIIDAKIGYKNVTLSLGQQVISYCHLFSKIGIYARNKYF